MSGEPRHRKEKLSEEHEPLEHAAPAVGQQEVAELNHAGTAGAWSTAKTMRRSKRRAMSKAVERKGAGKIKAIRIDIRDCLDGDLLTERCWQRVQALVSSGNCSVDGAAMVVLENDVRPVQLEVSLALRSISTTKCWRAFSRFSASTWSTYTGVSQPRVSSVRPSTRSKWNTVLGNSMTPARSIARRTEETSSRCPIS